MIENAGKHLVGEVRAENIESRLDLRIDERLFQCCSQQLSPFWLAPKSLGEGLDQASVRLGGLYFDADKSARITKIMYSGVTKKLQAPSDVQNAADGGQTGTQTQTP